MISPSRLVCYPFATRKQIIDRLRLRRGWRCKVCHKRHEILFIRSSDRGCRTGSWPTCFLGIDDGDRLDLDHEIGCGETGDADGCAGRCRHPEIAHADVGALLELVEV